MTTTTTQVKAIAVSLLSLCDDGDDTTTAFRILPSAPPPKEADILHLCKDNGNARGPPLPPLKGVDFLTICPRGLWVATGAGRDTNVWIWSMETGQLRARLPHKYGVQQVVWGPPTHSDSDGSDGNDDRFFLATASYDNNIKIWDWQTEHCVRTLMVNGGNDDGDMYDFCWCLDWSHAKNYLIAGTDEWDIYLWQASTGERLRVLHGHNQAVKLVQWSPQTADWLASTSGNAQIMLWSTDTWTRSQTLTVEAGQGFVTSLCWTTTTTSNRSNATTTTTTTKRRNPSCRLAVATSKGYISIWKEQTPNAKTGPSSFAFFVRLALLSPFKMRTCPDKKLRMIHWSPNGQRVVGLLPAACQPTGASAAAQQRESPQQQHKQHKQQEPAFVLWHVPSQTCCTGSSTIARTMSASTSGAAATTSIATTTALEWHAERGLVVATSTPTPPPAPLSPSIFSTTARTCQLQCWEGVDYLMVRTSLARALVLRQSTVPREQHQHEEEALDNNITNERNDTEGEIEAACWLELVGKVGTILVAWLDNQYHHPSR